jgi:hypothetical protein
MPRVRVFTITKGKKRKTKIRIGLGLPILYIAYLLLGLIFGIQVNGNYYAREKAFYARLRAEPMAGTTPVKGERDE